MGTNPYKRLTISGKYYSERELTDFAENKLSGEPVFPWEIDLFGFILEWLSDSPQIKVKTSGSTGVAKRISVKKEKMISSALLTGRFFNLKKNDKALLCLPVNFIAGKMMVVRAFVLGLDLIPVEPSGNPLKNPDEPFDFAAMTPMQVYSVFEEKGGNRKLNQIKNLIIGGGDIGIDLLNSIKKLDNNTFHTYGMTETLTHIALKKLNGRNPDFCFKALSGIKFSKDERGCLVIFAPHLSEGQFITNDIVDLIDETTFKYIGRYDNVINTGGIKVYPELAEQKIKPFMNDRFIIGGIPDEQLGHKVILIIERENDPAFDFKKKCNEANLSKYEIPKQVYFLDQFPETANGKIIRPQVVEMVLENLK